MLGDSVVVVYSSNSSTSSSIALNVEGKRKIFQNLFLQPGAAAAAQS